MIPVTFVSELVFLAAWLFLQGIGLLHGLSASEDVRPEGRLSVAGVPEGMEITEANQYDLEAPHYEFLRSDRVPPIGLEPEAWAELTGDEREKFRAATRRWVAAKVAGDEAAADAVILEYARSPGRLVTKDLILLKYAMEDRMEPSERALQDLRLVAASARGDLRDLAAYEEVKVLGNLGRRDEALARAKALPSFGVGELRNHEDLRRSALRASLLLSLGERDAARQAFLSASPADPGLRPAYVQQADLFAGYLRMTAGPGDGGGDAAAANFRDQVVRRYPEALAPEFVGRMVTEAMLAGDAERAENLRAVLEAHHPNSPAVVAAWEIAAVTALADGDKETAVEFNGKTVDAPAAPLDKRQAAARRLRMLGVPTDESDLAPVPDPIGNGGQP